MLVSATVAQHGMDGLILATFLAGLMLAAVGFLRLGTFIKFIPFPVTVGFTAGIAVIIFASQIKEMLGISLGHEPGELLKKLPALWDARTSSRRPRSGYRLPPSRSSWVYGKLRPHWPGMLIAVGMTAAATGLLGLSVETIGTKFGGIPSTSAVSEAARTRRSNRSWQFCRLQFLSPCSARSSRCSRPWSPTA